MSDVTATSSDPTESSAPADLYFRTHARGLEYRRFPSTDEAIAYAQETLSPKQYNTSVIESADRRWQVDKQGAFVRSED